jgi:transglycosylase-like protein
MRRLMTAGAAVGIVALTGACTPSEVDTWLAWWQDDPAEAEEFAHQDWVQRSLEWGCDSYCDVDDPDLHGGDDGSTSSEDSQESVESSESDESSSEPDFSGGGTVWDSLAACESGGDWGINTGNGYYGGLQFLLSTWQAYGGSGYPHENSREEQIRVAENLRADAGFSPWPSCAAQLGLL